MTSVQCSSQVLTQHKEAFCLKHSQVKISLCRRQSSGAVKNEQEVWCQSSSGDLIRSLISSPFLLNFHFSFSEKSFKISSSQRWLLLAFAMENGLGCRLLLSCCAGKEDQVPEWTFGLNFRWLASWIWMKRFTDGMNGHKTLRTLNCLDWIWLDIGEKHLEIDKYKQQG